MKIRFQKILSARVILLATAALLVLPSSAFAQWVAVNPFQCGENDLHVQRYGLPTANKDKDKAAADAKANFKKLLNSNNNSWSNRRPNPEMICPPECPVEEWSPTVPLETPDDQSISDGTKCKKMTKAGNSNGVKYEKDDYLCDTGVLFKVGTVTCSPKASDDEHSEDIPEVVGCLTAEITRPGYISTQACVIDSSTGISSADRVLFNSESSLEQDAFNPEVDLPADDFYYPAQPLAPEILETEEFEMPGFPPLDPLEQELLM